MRAGDFAAAGSSSAASGSRPKVEPEERAHRGGGVDAAVAVDAEDRRPGPGARARRGPGTTRRFARRPSGSADDLGRRRDEATRTTMHVRSDPVVQPRRAALRAVGSDRSPGRVLRVMDVDVELVERPLQLRARPCGTDLRADRVPHPLCVDHEVLVWRVVGHARIREPWPGERQERERTGEADGKQGSEPSCSPPFSYRESPARDATPSSQALQPCEPRASSRRSIGPQDGERPAFAGLSSSGGGI